MTNNNKQITLENIEKIILKVASPERILDNSFGEVLKSETINYRTQKPEKDGLFCEKIFGPKVDINIHDNKFKGVRTKELAVDKQGRIVTKSSSRRERMGHVKLQVPVTHTWFLRTNPSPIGYAVNMSVKTLERVVYFSAYLITKIDEAKKAALKDDLEAWFENEKKVLADKFEQMASSEEKSLKEVAKQRTTELEQLNNEYLQRKIQLGGLNYKAVLTEDDYANLPDEYQDIITVGMGAETVHEILKNTDLEKVIADLKEEADNASGQRYKKLLKRMKILEGIHQAGIKPEWFCLTVLPVIPPELRPMVQLSGGRFATSDLNDLYRRVINRNNRLKKLMSLGAPSLICRNEMRMLQEAVDSVLDNTGARGNRAVTATGGRRKLKSLTDVLKGKQGRLRGNLLGKRVDYSGRSVIVAGPDLKLDECGLPKIMALELFKPHVIGWLIANEHATNMRGATRLIELAEDVVWDALDSVIAGKRVLLNRAPTLHRLSILSFKPRLIEGRAIQLHPLVCAGFNADYDGDQMAVHLPISEEAQAEARDIMSPEQNLLKPADGSPILHITQDIVLGAYWLTHQKEEHKKLKTRDFSSGTEVEMAYECGDLTVHSPIRLKIAGERVETTYGRLLFNDVLPRGFKFVNEAMDSKTLNALVLEIFEDHGAKVMANVADRIKQIAFKWATTSGFSSGMDDYKDLKTVDDIITEGSKKYKSLIEEFDLGTINDEEKKRLTIKIWSDADKELTDVLREESKSIDTTMEMAIASGARGSINNLKQITGMKGLVIDAAGRTMDFPIKNNYKKGFNPVEYAIDSRGARKGLTDTALKTADAGYLTRRMVDVAQDVFSVNVDLGNEGFDVYRKNSESIGVDFGRRVSGRYAFSDIVGEKGLITKAGDLITKFDTKLINEDKTIEKVRIYSVLSSKNLRAVSIKDYGIDLGTDALLKANTAIGVIAAQSIGEYGTQLTMRTKHAAGAASEANVTSGLPRVVELLEARAPKGCAILSPFDGDVTVYENGDDAVVEIKPKQNKSVELELEGRIIRVENGEKVKIGDVIASMEDNSKQLIAPFNAKVKFKDQAEKIQLEAINVDKAKFSFYKGMNLLVKDGDMINAGDPVSAGPMDPHQVLELKGVEAAQRYIVEEILAIYAMQGVNINDKHLEVIIRQMFSKVEVEDSGDSLFVVGDIATKASVLEENERLVADGKKPIEYSQKLMGITRVATHSDSWLSAASFQDTTHVLVAAAISGKEDPLHGLKENVIIGGKIPVGTGARDIVKEEMDELEITE